MNHMTKLSAMQIENILDRVVPLIADPQDHEFFRAVIGLKLENISSARASVFINNLLNS